MELRQLRYFVTVAEEASFTRAAARLHVAQPGVSAQVRQLERELGHDLLDRAGRTVRLTEVGAAVLPYARAAMDAAGGARLAVDELTGLVRGHVALGMAGPFSSDELDVPSLLASFHQRYPTVQISLSEATSDVLVDALRERRLDLALIGLASAPPQGVATRIVVNEPLVAAVAGGDQLAGRRGIALASLRERSLICLPRGTGLRTVVDEACAAAGFRPQIAFEGSDPEMLAQLASRGLGVAVLPGSAARAHRGDLHTVAITRPRLRGRIALAWRADGPANPAAKALLARAHQMFPESPDQP